MPRTQLQQDIGKREQDVALKKYLSKRFTQDLVIEVMDGGKIQDDPQISGLGDLVNEMAPATQIAQGRPDEEWGTGVG